MKESNQNMIKYLKRDPAAGSGIQELERKIKLLKISNIKKTIVLANKVALE